MTRTTYVALISRHLTYRLSRKSVACGTITLALVIFGLFLMQPSNIRTIVFSKLMLGYFDTHYNASTFKPLNERGIHSFWNVCIEPTDQPIQNSFKYFKGRVVYNETQRIIVYNYNGDRTGKHTIGVAGSSNTLWNKWDIFFTNKSIPETHKLRSNTAFFVVPTCPVNMHHFWVDEFIGLYSVVKKTNKLFEAERNQILYRQPFHLLKDYGHLCWNYTRYEDILRTLHIDSFHGVFYNMEPNTCFQSAVFGTATVGLSSLREVTDYVLREFKFDKINRNDAFITILDRSNRRVLNVYDLLNASIASGLRNVRVVKLESLSLPSQAQIAATSKVMIGIQGAGLQWAAFMPKGSTLIEIAWPNKHWGFYYRGHIPAYSIHHIGVVVEERDVLVNWTTYENMVRAGQRVPEKERKEMLNQPPKDAFDNLWKHADVRVDVSLIVAKLLKL